MSVEGKFETTVSLAPQKSQIFTVGCLVLSGVSLLASCAFLWAGKAGWEVPLAGSFVFGMAGFACWLLSHRNSDLSGGRATQLTADERSMTLTFDPRNQPTKQMLLMFAAHAESMAFRECLPHSRGLLDDSGNVIKDSEVEANLQIEQLNMVVIEQAEKLERLACEIKSGVSSLGESISAPMYTGEEPVEGVTLVSGT
ncbi:hypothetical protein [Pseudomonas fluorescens]|nr:hypothetical protein [Pseudomonas fluorescens]